MRIMQYYREVELLWNKKRGTFVVLIVPRETIVRGI